MSVSHVFQSSEGRRHRLSRIVPVLVFLVGACAPEGSEEIRDELRGHEMRIGEGLEKIERALLDPELTFKELGHGIALVEGATRDLSALEVDPRSSELEQLEAIILRARAWDDVATAYQSSRRTEQLSDAQKRLIADIFRDKSLKARSRAEDNYRFALDRACTLGLQEHPLAQEPALFLRVEESCSN